MAIGSESYSRSTYWLISQIIEQIMEQYEASIIPIDLQGSVDISDDEGDGAEDSIKVADGNRSRTGAFNLNSNTKESPRSERSLEERRYAKRSSILLGSVMSMSNGSGMQDYTRYSRFRNWVNDNIRFTISPDGKRSENRIHGHTMSDILPLIGAVFKENVPYKNTSIPNLKARSKALLLKTLIVRVLEHALGDGKVVLWVENLQWSDTLSAQALNDFIAVSKKSFGVFCYRTTLSSHEVEHECFMALRQVMMTTTLKALRSQDIALLAAHFLGHTNRNILNRDTFSRIEARTQRIPGLVEALMKAYKSQLDLGNHNISIERLRTKGQESIMQQFDVLDSHTQSILKNAAAMGLQFSFASLLTVDEAISKNRPSQATGGTSNGRSTVGKAGANPTTALRRNASAADETEARFSEEAVAAAAAVAAAFLASGEETPSRRNSTRIDVRKQLWADLMKLENRFLCPVTDFKPLRWEKAADIGSASIEEYSPIAETKKARRMSSVRRALGASVTGLHESKDTPEIALYALPWTDAQGNWRRSWAAAVMDKRKMGRRLAEQNSSIRQFSQARLNTSFGDKSDFYTFFKFAHPSIQSKRSFLLLEFYRPVGDCPFASDLTPLLFLLNLS
jgi:hypothetical protein